MSIIISQFANGSDLNNLVFGDYPILYIVSSFMASYALIHIMKSLDDLGFNLKYLNFLGKNSLFIMCTHLPLWITQVLCAILSMLFILASIPNFLHVPLVLMILSVVEYFLLLVRNYIKLKAMSCYKCEIIKYI